MSTHRKGPAVADNVTIRNEFGEEKRVPKAAVERGFFPGYVVLDAAGRKKAQQPATASSDKKES
jgi:hypothetical protein